MQATRGIPSGIAPWFITFTAALLGVLLTVMQPAFSTRYLDKEAVAYCLLQTLCQVDELTGVLLPHEVPIGQAFGKYKASLPS